MKMKCDENFFRFYLFLTKKINHCKYNNIYYVRLHCYISESNKFNKFIKRYIENVYRFCLCLK